jgi:hypothetical protein
MKSGELLAGLTVCLALGGGPAWADDPAPSLFGRVGTVAGSVQYRPSGGEWSDALINEPVATGVGIRSARDAAAELHIAGARVAIAPSSELSVVRLDRDVFQIAVARGRVGIHLDPAGAAKIVEIDLPRGAVWLAEPGDYNIVTGEGHEPRIEVLAGTALLGGGLDPSNLAAATTDSFSDGWRDEGAGSESADSHLTSSIAGAASLAASGTWETSSQYGDVWYPKEIAADWAPYRDGVWRFLAPWGWTWVDAAPWGFAPSHYGRWAKIDERWAWVPGRRGDDPDYSPAQVAFLGTAPFGLSCPGDTGPAIAWFPLGPSETVGDGNDYNYLNRRFASAVPRAVFASGKPVLPALTDLPEQRFADAPVILGPLGIVPATAAVKVAAAKPAVIVVAAAPQPPARKPYIVRLRDTPPSDARRRLALAANVARPRLQPSTGALHSTHTRQHLAAARGGA